MWGQLSTVAPHLILQHRASELLAGSGVKYHLCSATCRMCSVCVCVCLGSDPYLRQQMKLWCCLETLTALVCAAQCSPGAAAEVQILPAGCSCRALEGCPWPSSCSLELSEHFLQVFPGFSAREHPRWSRAASSLCCLLC